MTPPLTAATSERPSIVALSLPSAPAEPPPAALSALPATVPPTSAPGPVSPPPAGACDPSSIVIPVESLSTGWPGPIRQELAALNGSARVTLPKAEVSAGLARGRVTFTWGQIRGWLQPSSGASTDADEGTELILPLKVVAPLFLTGTKTPKHEQAPAFETDIPALFNPAHEDAAPVAEPVLAPDAFEVEEPAPTLILAEAPAEAPAETPAETATTVGELFGQPEKSEWTPGELVSNLARLDGVAGAVVALQEGLLVAHSLPADVKSEAIAAFLPQLFSRLNQYSAEMKLGEVDDLLFTTHGAHCQIYRLGFIYFAVLGKPGETLPWKEMRLVADELVAQTQKS